MTAMCQAFEPYLRTSKSGWKARLTPLAGCLGAGDQFVFQVALGRLLCGCVLRNLLGGPLQGELDGNKANRVDDRSDHEGSVEAVDHGNQDGDDAAVDRRTCV